MKSVRVNVGFEKVTGNSPSALQESVEEFLTDIPEDISINYCKAEVDDFEDNDEKGSGNVLVEFVISETNEEFADSIDSDDATGPSDDDITEAAESQLEKYFSKIRSIHEVDITIEESSVEEEEDDE